MDLQTGFLSQENFEAAFSSIQRQPKLESLKSMTVLDSLLSDFQCAPYNMLLCLY